MANQNTPNTEGMFPALYRIINGALFGKHFKHQDGDMVIISHEVDREPYAPKGQRRSFIYTKLGQALLTHDTFKRAGYRKSIMVSAEMADGKPLSIFEHGDV